MASTSNRSRFQRRARAEYRLFIVLARVTIEDDDGHVHDGWSVDAVSRDDLDAARAVADSFPSSHARYYVSADPPYFLGKEWIAWRDGSGRTVDKRWRLTHHELLEVGARDRVEAILRVRARRGAGQVIPWRERPPGGR